LLRICIFIALATGISFALQWIAAGYRVESDRYIHLGTWRFRRSFDGRGARRRLNNVATGRRPFGDYGLPVRWAFGKLFWQGALFGLIEISAVIGFIAALGSYHFGSLAIHGVQLLNWALFWGACFVIVALYEEFTFRGYPQFALTQAAGFWPAALLLSIAFGLVHRGNPGESKLGLAG